MSLSLKEIHSAVLKAFGPATNAKKGSRQGERVMDEEEEDGGVEREGKLLGGNKSGCRETSSLQRGINSKGVQDILGKRGSRTQRE